MSGLSLARIPEWILAELPTLERLHRFNPLLARFSKKYRKLIDSKTRSEENQESLLKKTLRALINCDRRFAATYNPLALLNFFDKRKMAAAITTFTRLQIFSWAASRLTGVMQPSSNFGRPASPSASGWSTEYVWLLTVFFHDVGYPVQ